VDRLRAAVAGVGFMGTTHAETLRRIGIEVAGILGITREEGQAAASKLGTARVYGTFDELVADPVVDVVHICTPNHLHYGMSKAALEAGKHVICEKPLAMNLQESSELAQLAEVTGLVAAVNHNLRYYPLCHEARARLQAREIGEVRLVHGEYLQDWLFLPTDWNWRLEPQLGGELRAVADIGTHWLDMITWLTDSQVVAVMADLATIIPKRLKPQHDVETFAGKMQQARDGEEVEIHTEDYASILLTLDNGARGMVLLSQVSAGRKNRLWWEVNGSKASLSWDQERPNELWIGHRDRPNEVLLKDPALMHANVRHIAGYPGGHAEGYPDTFLQLARDVYRYIESGDFSQPATYPTFADAHRLIQVGEAIRTSACERRWVEIPQS